MAEITPPPGYVMIRDKAYKTIAKRVAEFREKYGLAYGIVTTLVTNTEDSVLFRAEITYCGEIVATGHASEIKGQGNINTYSALENCETSAIGRALAAAGFGGSSTEYASAEEMIRATKMQDLEEDGAMSPVRMRDYCERILTAVEAQDGPGLLQIYDELTNAQKLWLGHKFRSYEGRAISELLAKARAAANIPDPRLRAPLPVDGDTSKDTRRATVREVKK